MKIAYGWMFGERYLRIQETSFRAQVDGEKGWLNVQCPGSGCGLCPSHHGIERGRGYEFDSHNVDSPIQQLTLLAGLAALHDRARREIKDK